MNTQQIPNHIAVIMDGNRRWAREHHLPVLEGHRRVANTVLEQLVEHASDVGISYMTFWAFSTENWARPSDEVKGIMTILRKGIVIFGNKMHKKGVQLRVIGDISKFDEDIRKSIAEVVELTRNNKKITVTLALNYGGRDEILRGVSRFMCQVSRKNMTHDTLTPDTFGQYLDTSGVPDPDLIIRTGGEQRLSGFLPWQSVYSELYFPMWFMPDFTPEKLDEAVEEYKGRMRRFGK